MKKMFTRQGLLACCMIVINATISKISQYEGAGSPSKSMPNYIPMEEVSFIFQKIEVLNNAGKTISADDWLVEK